MFREQIRKYYDHLSRSYRRVADFILSDYHTAAFMTAAALAQAVQVDTTTVVRFAQRLGYPGFPELSKDIQEQVKLELSRSYVADPEDRTLQSQVQQLVIQERGNLEKALAHNSLDTLEAILGILRSAPRIVVVGESYAAPLARSFAAMLKDAGLPAVFASGDAYDRAVALSHLERKEVVIGMTPVEGESGVSRVLRYARDEGAITIACTPSISNQAARTAEVLLYAPGEAAGTLPSLTGLHAICTAIAQVLAALEPGAATRRAGEIQRVLSEIA